MQKGFQTVKIHSCGDGVIASPVIGENGNWFIGNDDTGTKATGIDGQDGPMGPEGPQGIQGAKGDQGDIGPAGPQGIQGIRGIQGIKGEIGATGSQGLKGDKGDTPELSANLTTIVAGKALDATMGKNLDDKITEVDRSLGDMPVITLVPVTDFFVSVPPSIKDFCCTKTVIGDKTILNISGHFDENELKKYDNITIATVKDIYRPNFTMITCFAAGYYSSTYGTMWITRSNGLFQISTATANRYFTFNFNYLL